MSLLFIQNGTVALPEGMRPGTVVLQDGKIAETDFRGELPANAKVLDAAGMVVAPGFVDIHLHGGGGYDFMDGTPEAFREIAAIHLQNGATTIVPTAVSADFDSVTRFMEVYRQVAGDCPNLHGVHLEGPYISPAQKGAHKEKFLHAPTPYETARLLELGQGILTTVTAAPELPGMAEFAEAMGKNGVLLSVGHSNATSEEVFRAFDWGFSHVTHLYSATTTVRKVGQTVKAGIVEAAYLQDGVTVELIADGCHAAVDALRLAVKIKGTGGVALVTDALRPAGTHVSESYLGEKIPENRVIIEDGVAKLPDRSFFAGSIATAGTVLKKACTHYGFSLHDAIKMLSETPARIVKLPNKGKLLPGMDADLVLLSDRLEVCRVIKNGIIM